MKVCTCCKEEKEFTEFQNYKRGKDGKRPICKACRSRQEKIARATPRGKELSKATRERYKAKHGEEAVKEFFKKYYNDKKDTKEYKERASVYYQNNKQRLGKKAEMWRQDNKHKMREYRKKWRVENRDVIARLAMKRIAAKKQATPKWAEESEWEQFFLEEIYNLSALRQRLTKVKHEVDHIVPLQSDVVSGLHVSFNLRVIPKADNISKSNKWWPDMPIEEKQETRYNAAS